MAVKVVMALLMVSLVSAIDMQAQTKAQLIQQADSTYQSNILKSRLNGVYIPKDLEDAFLELDRLSPKDALDKIKAEDENYIARKLHFGLGRWMAYNWNFDEGSRFSHYLKGLGLFHSEDMIDFMLISYHRYLNQRPQQIEERIKNYRAMREKKDKMKVKTQ
ncbi:MAG: hypothetical protein IPN29_16530 [Saprospiraceae bacterium]|nr:hypothetical protein [Saprospiraceae bacterium]